MASVRERNGKFTGLYRDKDGAQKSAGTFRTRVTALQHATAAEKDEKAGRDGSARRPVKEERVYPSARRGDTTVAGYYPTWQRRISELEPTSRESYIYMTRKHILPALGSTTWATLDTDAVFDFMAGLKKAGIGGATQGHILTVLRSMCRYAVTSKLLESDPTAGVKVKDRQAPEMKILARDEYDLILKAIDPHYALLVRTLVSTGLRFGEAMGLQGGDVVQVPSGWAIKVRRVMIEVNGVPRTRDHGKTRKALRTITIEGDLAGALTKQASADPQGFAFRTSRGAPVSRSNFRRVWVRALKDAGLKGIRVHDLRHTHASWLLANGASLVAVRDRLGHTDIRTTSRYLHTLPDSDDGCLGAMSRALG